MAYLALAYPKLKEADLSGIQRYRKDNDELFYTVVDPHFTLVFPINDVPQNVFIDEVASKIESVKSFDFVLRCSTINKDAFSDYYHAFLVPDEGFSDFVKLHDRLYSDKFKSHHRFDLDFIPHIGLGNSKDMMKCKGMVDDLNSREFAIAGTISQITVVAYNNSIVTSLKDFALV
jgi:2'-5' RNA ligase